MADVRLEEASEARVYGSVLESSGASIHLEGTNTCLVSHSEIEGSVSAGCQCVGAHDPTFTPLDATCQPPGP
jgi:hypothetical protein